MPLTHADGSLTLARQRLDDAVRAMADPVPEWLGGACRWAPPLYLQLRVGLSGNRTAHHGVVQHRSRPPCRVDVLALLCEIDATVSAWTLKAKGGTVKRLHQLAGRGWRPQDAALIGFYVGEIRRWVITAEGLLAPTRKVDLHMPCPHCGARFAHRRDDGGNQVRVWALRMSEEGCGVRLARRGGRRSSSSGWHGCFEVSGLP